MSLSGKIVKHVNQPVAKENFQLLEPETDMSRKTCAHWCSGYPT